MGEHAPIAPREGLVNTRDLLKELVALGGSWQQKSGTGEIVCSHPCHNQRVRISHWTRRKSAPRALIGLVAKARAAE